MDAVCTLGRAWFACSTRSRHERAVAVALERKGIDCYLPLLPRISRWSDRSKTIWWPAFPDYLFVRISAAQMTSVRTTPGLRCIVSNGSQASVVRDVEIENVRRAISAIVRTGVTLDESVLAGDDASNFSPGEPVRVVDGPFQGVEGLFRDRRGSGRLLITVGPIGRTIALNIDGRMVKRLVRSVD